MTNKEHKVGDIVEIKTNKHSWRGQILESYDSEIILIKLESGYNIGIRKDNALEVKILGKTEQSKKKYKKIKQNKELPNIVMIITGGTISAKLDPKTGGVIYTDAGELLKMAPGIDKICNIVKVEKPFTKFSEDISFKDWITLSEVCEKHLNDENIDGLIITHGTDFLHYTSSALSIVLGKINKPIALTYSQRSIDRASSDAALNLLCAAKFASSEIAEIALVGHENLEDKSCLALPGTKVRKMHTTRRDTFKAINEKPIARITKDSLQIMKEVNLKSKNKIKRDAKFSEKVALIKITPGQDPEILDYYKSKGYRGIVLELAGLGQVPGKNAKYDWIKEIKKMTREGLNIVGVSQTINGAVNPRVYSPTRETEKAGLIYLRDMLPETALVKLSWVLGHPGWMHNKEKIKEKMLENRAGEFNEQIGFDCF